MTSLSLPRSVRSLALGALLTCVFEAHAAFHLWRVSEIFSNASGTVQFIELSTGSSGENLVGGQTITVSQGGRDHVFVFPGNLTGDTANRRLLIATQGFANLGIVTPDFLVPDGFLFLPDGVVNFADVDVVTYTLPADGVTSVDRAGRPGVNSPVNFAGQSGSVSGGGASNPIVIENGVWWDPAQSGTGYGIQVRNGVLVMQVYSYRADGEAQWYLTAGPLANGNRNYSGTLDKYRAGQCIACPYTGSPSLSGNDGVVTIVFSSGTSATLTRPGGIVSNIVPLRF